jgi:NTP pyrophosphatase (non-canonical NTP hydrolase)
MDNYIQQATRTESLQFNAGSPRLLHATLGIVTELMEYEDAVDDDNALEELGDIYWYVAIAADELGLTFDELKDQGAPKELSYHEIVGGLCDVMKRSCFYGVHTDIPRFTKYIGTLLHWLDWACKMNDTTPEERMEANIAKLRKRFPEKFTTQDAVERRDQV